MIWGCAANKYLSRLHILQKRIIRIICNVHFLAHTEPLFESCKIMTIHQLNVYLVSVYMFKVWRNMLPECAQILFIRQHEVHDVQTRQVNYFHLPLCRTEIKKNTLSYTGPFIWNKTVVPSCIIDRSLHIFKKSLRTAIFYT